jgi:N-acyl-D-aspartate/D-glutamate deacylase
MLRAEAKAAAKDVVIVHGALVDGSGWRAVHDILVKDGYHVTIVQEPLTGLAEDVDMSSISSRARWCWSDTATVAP